MQKRAVIAFFLFAVNAGIIAEDIQQMEVLPHFRGRAIILDIEARVLEQDKEVIWNETHRRLTIPGNPVGIKLVGSNVVVVVQFTPFIRRRGGNVLVAQGQIWIDVPNEGVRHHTSIQTIPLDFDDPIYFFPLGQARQLDGAFIEIMLTMKPYREADDPSAARPGNGN